MLLLLDEDPTLSHATLTLQLAQHCSATNDKRERGLVFHVIFAAAHFKSPQILAQ